MEQQYCYNDISMCVFFFADSSLSSFVKEFRAKAKSVQQGADLFQDFLIVRIM